MPTKDAAKASSKSPLSIVKPLKCSEKGINLIHSRLCSSRDGGGCDCEPTFQGQAWSPSCRHNLRRVFKTLDEAKAWRKATTVALSQPGAIQPGDMFFDRAAEKWLTAAKKGVVRTRSGTPFKPSALRSYEDSLRRFLIPKLGRTRLNELKRAQIQDVVDEMVAADYAPSTVRNAVLPLRSICRRAYDREELQSNPTRKIELPIDRRTKDRVAPPQEVENLLGALPEHLRLIWGLAIYTGLRRGELQALGWENVDFETGVIEVERSWDRVEGFVEPKSRAGFRLIPLPGVLRGMLLKQRLIQGSGGVGMVIGQGDKPFDPSNAIREARRVWEKGGLTGIGYHECRHTYASLMIAAGVNAKTLSVYMGHSSIVMTIDRYGHLFPGNEKDSAAKLDQYLGSQVQVERSGGHLIAL